MDQPNDHSIQDGKIWCESCKNYTKFLSVPKAATIADVHTRTIRRYIEGGDVYVIRIVGRSVRVCSECLLRRENSDPQ